jgi:type I restriction enzyme S subunit
MTNSVKPSGIDWIGDVPIEWEVKSVKYILESNKNALKETTKSNYVFKYIDISSVDFDKGIIGYEEMNFENAPSRARRIVKKGDTIISTVRTYLKAITRIEDDKNVIVSTGFAVLSPKNNDPVFIEYYCKSDAFCSEIEKLSYGIAYPAINESVLINIKIILPPLKEQQAIAVFLDTQCGRLDGIITEIEQQIEVLKQYKTSLITETITKGLNKSVSMKDSGIDWIGNIPAHWEIKRLKFLGTARNGLTYDPEKISDEGILVLRSSNIKDGNISFDDNVYVNMKVPKEIIIRENDILICSRNGSRELIGKCALIDKQIEGNTYGAFMCVFRSPYNQFLYYIFQSDLFNYYLGNYLTSTINQLTNTNLYNMKIPITLDMKEQEKIVVYLNQKCHVLNNLIAEKRQSIETMRAYKKSLIYEYVTGKKRVKGYQ